MSFENPAGLWLLLGIPVLILIWLIRPRHEERPVSSSYIWKLSDRFMKKRLPFSRMEKWLGFVLQLLLIAGIALIAAHPVLNNGDRIRYVAIVDRSASMLTTDADGRTRLEAALVQVREKAEETGKGHLFSVITAGDEPAWLIREADTADAVQSALNSLTPGYGKDSLAQAVTLAQLYAEEYPETEILLYTDKTVNGEAEGLTVISLAEADSWNAALIELTVNQSGSGSYTVSGTAVSYGKDAELTIGLKVNGTLKSAKNISCLNGIPVQVTFAIEGSGTLKQVELYMEPGDDLKADNSLLVCREQENPCSVLLVTDTPLYLQTALTALNRGTVDLIGTADYHGQTGYDLYIFDGMTPTVLPEDGSVLLIGPTALPEGMTKQSDTVVPAMAVTAINGSSLQTRLLKDMQLKEISVAARTPVKATAAWESILNCAGRPVLLSRVRENNTAVTVLLFDLHDSNLPLLSDFLVLLRNCMNLAVPGLTDTTEAAVGEAFTVTPARGSGTLTVTSPDGRETVLTATGEYTPDMPGVVTLRSGSLTSTVAVHIPAAESAPDAMDAPVVVIPENDGNAAQATSGLWALLAGILLILLLTEWSIYIHEQS